MICVFKCPGCGSKMRFSPETQRLICDSCNSEMYVNEYDEKNIVYEGAVYYDEGYRKLECPNCGSIHIKEGNEAVVKCLYCDDEMVAIGMSNDDIMPEKIIPLAITESQALDKVIGWWIKHESMPELNVQKMKMTFSDIYIPVWLYDVDTVTTVNADIEHSYVDKNMDILSSDYKPRKSPDWGRKSSDYNLLDAFNSNRFGSKINSNTDEFLWGSVTKSSTSKVFKAIESSFQKIPQLATGHFSSERFHGIEPFNYYGLKSFKPSYLSGHNAENYEFKHDELLPHVTKRIKKYALEQCYNHVEGTVAGGDIKKIIDEKSEAYPENVYYALVPVWICTYWYRGKKYHLYVNGQTGKTDGDVIFAAGKYEADVIAYSAVTMFMWMIASLTVNTIFFDFAIMVIYIIFWLVILYENYGYLISDRVNKLTDNSLKIKFETPINMRQTVITRLAASGILLVIFILTFFEIKTPDLYTVSISFICGLVISVSSIIKFSIKRKHEMTSREEADYKDYIVECGTRVLASTRM